MGAAIGAVYSVPLKELRAVVGSRDKKVARTVQRDFYQRDAVDMIFEDDDPPNTVAAAMRQIVNGETLDRDKGSLYGYALEALCWYVGSTFILPMAFPSEKTLDKYLVPRGCPVKVADLVFSGYPLRIPDPGDYPFAGRWAPKQIKAALAFFNALSVKRASKPIQVGVAEIRRWLEEAAGRPGDSLVGFYY